MAYLGINPKVAYSSYRNIDDISASFDGLVTTFPLTVNGVAPTILPINEQQVLINVGGVPQQPDPSGVNGFKLLAGNIVFSSAPSFGETFWGVILATANYISANTRFADGSANLPSVTFASDVTTGVYSPGAGQLAISTDGTGRLFVDSSGRVGIGTSSPQLKLDVATLGTYGVIYQPTVNLRNTSSGGAITSPTGLGAINWSVDGVYDVANIEAVRENPSSGTFSSLVFRTNPTNISTGAGTERLRIDSSGRLLVGTTSARGNFKIGTVLYDAAQQLEAGSQGFQSLVGGSPSTSGPYLMLAHQRSGTVGGNTVLASGDEMGTVSFHGGDGTNLVIGAAIKGEVDGTPGANDMPGRLVFSTTADGATNNAERVRIDSSGRVGIGTSSPVAKTEILTDTNGDGLRISYANTPVAGNGGAVVFALYNNASTLVPLASIKGIMISGGVSTEAGGLTFNTSTGGAAPAERMRITNTGRVGINETNPAQQLAVSHSGVDGISIADVNASSISTNILIANTRAGGFSNYYIYAVSNSALTFQVFSNGNVQNTNNSYGAISDIKLKENIVDANSQWNDLKALQVRKYNFKEGQTHTQIGLVAQEVELVSPGLVAESPDRDEEGNDLGTVTKSVNYSVLYMKAVKALQEAMERIEALEADVAQLKAA